MNATIAFATASEMSTPDADEELLLPLVPGSVLACWDDPTVDWSAYDAVAIRSTWNYTDHLEEFLTWVDRVSRVTRLVNGSDIVRWNADKRYLRDLADRGIPVVPTTFVAPGEGVNQAALEGKVVVKPTVGAGSKGAALFTADAQGALDHVHALHAEDRVAMIQPYVDAVDTSGETALVFLGGRFSHAARKAAILSREMSWSTGLYADEKIAPAIATEEQLDLARRVIDAAVASVSGASELAYARVDLLPSENGPVLLELELIEPSLFLAMDREAPRRAAEVFAALAEGERDLDHISI